LEAAGLHKGSCKSHPERSEAGFLFTATPIGDHGSNPPLSAKQNDWEMAFAGEEVIDRSSEAGKREVIIEMPDV